MLWSCDWEIQMESSYSFSSSVVRLKWTDDILPVQTYPPLQGFSAAFQHTHWREIINWALVAPTVDSNLQLALLHLACGSKLAFFAWLQRGYWLAHSITHCRERANKVSIDSSGKGENQPQLRAPWNIGEDITQELAAPLPRADCQRLKRMSTAV